MTKNELLKYAKENYPAGTKYKCPENIGWSSLGIGIHIVELGDEIKFRNDDEIDIIGKGYIYYKGEWAEILEKPKVETKFEKGKWYKNLGINENYIAKFKKIEKNTLWVCESYIYNNSFHLVSGDLTESFSNAVECPLEEIQQYLPADHPDKFTTSIAKEFVLPEKWFLRFKTKEVFDELCAKYAPEFIFYKDAGICNNVSKSKLGNYYYLDRGASFGEKITFEQFKKYVLKEEVKEEVKPNITWKIGDYVVFVENWSCSKKGDIDKIKELGTKVTILYLKKEGLVASPLHQECKLKVFSTLQEAQKFSDELLGKSKTGLGVEDLVKGEVYIDRNNIIFMYNDVISDKNPSIYKDKFYKIGSTISIGLNSPFKIYNNPKWLKTCIKQDKFIEQSELDKYDDEGNLMEYGFSYSDDNKYELVESFNFIREYMDIFNKIGMLPLITPEECYLKKQEVKNPLDDSEREVNINFSKPKQIKF